MKTALVASILSALTARSVSSFLPTAPHSIATLFEARAWSLSSLSPTTTTTKLAVIPERLPDPLSYAEQSRLYRRDFYTHDKWLQHRAKNRFVGSFLKIFDSGVVRQLADEVLLVGGAATFICLWNALLVTGWEDFSLLHHDPVHLAFLGDWKPITIQLPVEPFTLSSAALSLLLVFKTNTSYARWDEARKAWGVVVNNSRTVARESAAWALKMDVPDAEKYRLVRRIADAVWLFPRSLQRHLLQPTEDTEPYAHDVRQRCDPTLAEDIINARHKPSRALFEMSLAINDLQLDTIQRTTMDRAVSQLCDAMGGCDRIFGSPVPSIYTRHAARFLELWIFFLPLALWKPFAGSWNHWAMIPSSALMAFFLLGIEELAIQLEEPFSVLPLGKIAGGIGMSAEEHMEWMEDAMKQDQTDRRNSVLYS